MKNIKLIMVIFAFLTIISCKKNTVAEIFSTPPTPFHFFEKITIIEVDENVKSFELGGAFSEEPSFSDPNYFPVTLDIERTTAKHKVHFINNISYKYDRKEGLKVYQTIELIPENIKEEVQLVYSDNYYHENVKNCDSTIIRLIPKIADK